MKIPELVPSTVAIAGSNARFPVRRIFCVGQNYADHVREMGGDPEREEPFFFAKPADAVMPNGARLPFPSRTANLHHEVELVVALGSGGRDLEPAQAAGLIFGHAVGLDMTRRDLQAVARKAGRPWDMAKGFDQSAPIDPLVEGVPPATGAIALSVNGETRQSADLSQMIWAVDGIIAVLSSYVELAAGDLIFTGTPAGVGPVQPGDRLYATIAGLDPLEISYGPPTRHG
jgi:fumarylpyruvate hydrolase